MNNLWLIYSFEHSGYWPKSRCGYVISIREAGQFTFDEATEIVTQANLGIRGNTPQEAMLPVPHPAIMERA